MFPHDPFQGHAKGGKVSEKDPTQYGSWTPAKFTIVVLVFSIPYVGLAIYLFLAGIKIVAIIMMGVIVLAVLLAWLLRAVFL